MIGLEMADWRWRTDCPQEWRLRWRAGGGGWVWDAEMCEVFKFQVSAGRRFCFGGRFIGLNGDLYFKCGLSECSIDVCARSLC